MPVILQKYAIRNKQDLKNTFRKAFDLAELEVEQGHDVWVFVVNKHKVKSLKQGGYLWGVIYPIIGNEIGMKPNKLHEEYKELFQIKTTKHMSTKQLSEFTEQIRQHAAEFHGITTPDPNEIPEEILIQMQSQGII